MNTNIYGRLDQPIYGFDPIWILTHYVAHREALIFREHNGFVAIARWIGEQFCQMADCKLVCTLIYRIGMGFTIPPFPTSMNFAEEKTYKKLTPGLLSHNYDSAFQKGLEKDQNLVSISSNCWSWFEVDPWLAIFFVRFYWIQSPSLAPLGQADPGAPVVAV